MTSAVRRPAAATLSRRGFLHLGALGAGALGLGALGLTAACSPVSSGAPTRSAARAAPDFIMPTDREVAATEAARATSGRTAAFRLTAAPGLVDLGGTCVSTWAYGGEAVGPELRLSAGDRMQVTMTNQLSVATTVHWHGIRIRNDMDGAAPTTQEAVAGGGGTFDYDFVAPDPGTYWYHAHSGLQADRGLFGAMVVEDPDDRTGADADAVLVLDDWVDGLGTTPEAVLSALNPDLAAARGHTGHGGHGSAAGATDASTSPSADRTAEHLAVAAELVAGGHGDSDVLGGMTQHVAYRMHLINGRPTTDPRPVQALAGQRLRLRVVNAAADTPYRLAVAGHELTVVAVDGFDTVPAVCDTVVIGMAQRVDVLLTVRSGAWPVVARVEGRTDFVATVLRTPDAAPLGTPSGTIRELDGRLLPESRLRPAEHVQLPERAPDREYRVDLIQVGARYAWGMAGPDAGRLHMRQGERIRIVVTNTTSMWHPMHTHGHTFAVPEYGGLRRDTVISLPGTELAIELDADNPGEWMFHCHNAYHFEVGMAANLRYVR